ncbi:hypothetical protein LAZ67_19002392, partial [Cordylochernes scorpioides]
MQVLGIRFAPFSLPIERRLQTAAVLYYTTTFLFIGTLGILISLALLFTQYFFLVLLYFAWFVYDINVCNRGGRRSQWLRSWTVWKYFRDYYPVSLVKTAELDPNKNYILGYHPHGIICAGAFANFGTEATGFSDTYPKIIPHILTLQGNFYFPFNREMILLTGACSASKESIECLLNQKESGHLLCLVIGGAAEALDARPHQVCLTLQRRKGFVKLALKHGASLVPCFSFGENDLYRQFPNPPGSRLRDFQNKLTKIMGFSPPIFYGRGVFQYSLGLVPFRHPIHTV